MKSCLLCVLCVSYSDASPLDEMMEVVNHPRRLVIEQRVVQVVEVVVVVWEGDDAVVAGPARRSRPTTITTITIMLHPLVLKVRLRIPAGAGETPPGRLATR